LQRREVRRRGGGALDVVPIESGEQKRWRHIDDGLSVAVEYTLRQKREVGAHRQRDPRVTCAGTDPAANQREIRAGFAADRRDDGRARCDDVTIDGERWLGQRAEYRKEEGNRPDDSYRTNARNAARVAAAGCLCNQGGHVVAPEAAQSSESSELPKILRGHELLLATIVLNHRPQV
jgi:hypothetical protein